MRSAPPLFAAAGLLVGLVVLGPEAAALHFGNQTSAVHDAAYEPLLAENGSLPP
ncbi:hypothetical protein [Rhodococcoides kroppenstedtii]|uniref:hypothetical protein n=1 Tax=Rhodococcoides kroppenstedtii TaxID=293050 RepID=UPI00364597A6